MSPLVQRLATGKIIHEYKANIWFDAFSIGKLKCVQLLFYLFRIEKTNSTLIPNTEISSFILKCTYKGGSCDNTT